MGIDNMVVSEEDQRALALLNVCGITLENTSFSDWVSHIEDARRTITVAIANNIPFPAQLVREHKEFYGIS